MAAGREEEVEVPSNAQRGAYYKKRSKVFLQEVEGCAVGDLELLRMIHKPGKPAFGVKRDQFGADLLAVDDKFVRFVQVRSGRDMGLAQASEEFMRYPCPPGAVQQIHFWRRGARAPEVVTISR